MFKNSFSSQSASLGSDAASHEGQRWVPKPAAEQSGSVDTGSRGKVLFAPVGTWRRGRLHWRWAHYGAPNVSVMLCMLDFGFIAAALTIAFAILRDRLGLTSSTDITIVASCSLVVSMAFLYALGCYRWDTLVDRRVATSCLPVAIALSGSALFAIAHPVQSLFGPTAISVHSFTELLALVGLSSGATLVMTALSRVLFYAMAHQQWFRRRVLVIGTGDRAAYLQKTMSADAQRLASLFYFIGDTVVGGSSKAVREEISDATIGDNGRHIFFVAREFNIDEIVVALDERRETGLDALLVCRTNGIPVTQHDAFIERETGRVDLRCLHVSQLVYSKGFRVHHFNLALKRALDIVITVPLFFGCVPITLAAILALWIEGSGPIVFRQERVTQNGRSFWLYKLRTMCPDAERDGPQWSGRRDPRITRVGAILRRTRIDEMPQLLNVLLGDMSLVGPRPERPVFVEQLKEKIPMYELRHSVKAGLTGWAQVNYPYGASIEDAARKLEYDLYYIKNYSLVGDISILLQTLRVVIWPPSAR
jgi:sugar transferase (PEP-CTERM system associated)